MCPVFTIARHTLSTNNFTVAATHIPTCSAPTFPSATLITYSMSLTWNPSCCWYLCITVLVGGVYCLFGASLIMCPRDWQFFLCCHFFPVVSELVYFLLEHVVTNDDLEFCRWDMSRQGRLLVVLILIETNTVLITVQY